MLRQYVQDMQNSRGVRKKGIAQVSSRPTRANPFVHGFGPEKANMPPQVIDEDIDVPDAGVESDGPDEIPARIKPAAAAAEPAEDEEDDDDDEEGEEYRVEKILAHDFTDDGAILYKIKWLGYEKKADQTWEPVENLENAMDLVNAYHDFLGGVPIAPSMSTKKSKKGAKRSASTAALDSPAPEPKTKKGRKSDIATNGSTPLKKFPTGSWEEAVLRVHTVLEETDPTTPAKGRAGSEKKILLGLIEWADSGKKTQHPLSTLRHKCPQKLLDYYEQHLVFRSASAKDEADAEAAARVDDV